MDEKVRAVIEESVAELDGIHYLSQTTGIQWCALCGAADGPWPCTAAMVANDLRALLVKN